MSYKFLLTRRDGPVERLTLNRPDVRNAFNAEMIAELCAWAADFHRDPRGARAVVLQQGMEDRTANLPESEHIRFRVGINLGDVMVDEGDIFGALPRAHGHGAATIEGNPHATATAFGVLPFTGLGLHGSRQ